MIVCNSSSCDDNDDVINLVGIVALDNYLTSSTASYFSDSAVGEDLAVLKRHLDTTRFVAQKVITPTLVTFGVVGNVVNIAVLTRRWMKSSTNCYLTALAVYDILYLLLALLLSLNHYGSIGNRDWYVSLRRPVALPLTDTFSNTGVWLTLTFTVERYIAVCHPMKGKVWCTPRRAKVIVVVVCLSAALVTLPEFFDWTTAFEFDGATNRTLLRAVPTDFGKSKGYAVAYKYINQALFTFLPLALLSVFNALLVKAVVSANRWRQRMNNATAAAEKTNGGEVHGSDPAGGCSRGGGGGDRHSQSQQRITVMLITVVVVFLLCQTPQAVQNVLIAYLDKVGSLDEHKRTVFLMTANVFNVLVITNCCSNFILYSSFSSKFRHTFRRLFCGRCMTRRQRTTMLQMYSDAGGGGGGGVTTQPLGATAGVRRNRGHVDTVVVCNDLWQSDDVTTTTLNEQTTGTTTTVASRATTQVAVQLAEEMTRSFRSPTPE